MSMVASFRVSPSSSLMTWSAGQDGDILQHLLAAVAEAGRLDAHHVQGAPQTVDHQGAEGLALHVLGDDEQLLTGLQHLLQQGQDVG